MKEFVEKLKEHGYELLHSGSDHWYFTAPGADMRILHGNISGEIPELMVACLDEIERLGWSWCIATGEAWMGKTFPHDVEIELMKDGYKRLVVTLKTKTEACCNALLAVLEAG